MAEKTDRRIRKTRAQLRKGLAELMQEKSVSEITVKELVERVDINRSTFYLHYTDIYDLLEQTEQRLLKQFTDAVDEKFSANLGPNEFFQFLDCTFTILAENAPLCAALMGPNGDIAFLRTIEKLMHEKGMQALRAFTPRELPEQDLQYALSYFLAGCMGLVNAWLKNGCPEPPTHMAEIAMLLLREGISGMHI